MPLGMRSGAGCEGGAKMKVKVQVIIEYEGVDTPLVEEVACLCRGDLLPETIGLTLEEGKALLASIQKSLVGHQAAADVEQQRLCPACGRRQRNRGTHEIVHRTLFGKLHITSPRLSLCACRQHKKRSF